MSNWLWLISEISKKTREKISNFIFFFNVILLMSASNKIDLIAKNMDFFKNEYQRKKMRSEMCQWE